MDELHEIKPKIKEEFFPSLQDEFLNNEDFADSRNRIFPINNQTNIEITIATLMQHKDEINKEYPKKEQLFLWNKIAQVANANDYEIKEVIEENLNTLKGGKKMEKIVEVDFTKTEDFTKAVEKAVSEKLKGTDITKKLEKLSDIEKELAKAQNDIKELEKENENLVTKTTEKEEELKDYKAEQEKIVLATKRINELKESGLTFSSEEFISGLIKDMDDEKFESLKAELLISQKKETPEEKKKREEEEKKKKEAEKKKKAEAEKKENLVLASKEAGEIPNDPNNSDNDKLEFLDKKLREKKQLIL